MKLPICIVTKFPGNDGDAEYALILIDEHAIDALRDIRRRITVPRSAAWLRIEHLESVDVMLLREIPEGTLLLDGVDCLPDLESADVTLCEWPDDAVMKKLAVHSGDGDDNICRAEIVRLRCDTFGDIRLAGYQRHCDKLVVTSDFGHLLSPWLADPPSGVEEPAPAGEWQQRLIAAKGSSPDMLIPVGVWNEVVTALSEAVSEAEYLAPEEFDDAEHEQNCAESSAYLRAVLAMAEGVSVPEHTPEDEERRAKVLDVARHQDHVDGDLVDIPDAAVISDGDNNGCYVMGWVWCDFKGTELDKNNE